MNTNKLMFGIVVLVMAFLFKKESFFPFFETWCEEYLKSPEGFIPSSMYPRLNDPCYSTTSTSRFFNYYVIKVVVLTPM